MLIEFQLQAASLARVVRLRFAGARRPITDAIPNPVDAHNPYYVDRWTLGKTTFAMTTDDIDERMLAGNLGLFLPILQCTQKVNVFLASRKQLSDRNQRPVRQEDFLTDEVTVVFDLIADLDEDDNPGVTMTQRSVTSGLAGVLNGYSFLQRVPFDLSELPRVNKDAPTPSAVNVGVATNHAGDVLALRIEVDDQASDAPSAWHGFMNGGLTNRLFGDRWSIFMESTLLTSPLKEMLATQLKNVDSYRESGNFWLESGPRVKWSPIGSVPRLVGSFEGEVIDGCSAIFGPVDMNVDAELDIRITNPKPNRIRIQADLSVSLNAWEQFWCTFSEAFDPIGTALSSAYTVDTGFPVMGLSILAGPLLTLIILNAVFSDPLSVAGNKLPDIPGFKKVDDDHWVMDMDFNPPDTGLIENMRLTQLTPLSDALVFSGSFDHVGELDDPTLKIESWAEKKFTWQNDNPCAQSAPLLEVKVPFAASPGVLLVAPPEFVGGANGAYQVIVEEWDEHGIAMQLWINDTANKGSPLEILLFTTGGARYLTFSVPADLAPFGSDGDALDYANDLIAWRATACYLATSIWGKLGIFNPKWTVDPGPEGVVEDGEHIWTVVLETVTGDGPVTIHNGTEVVIGESVHERSDRPLQFDVVTHPGAAKTARANAVGAAVGVGGPELTIRRAGVKLTYPAYLDKVRSLLSEPPVNGPSRLSVHQTLAAPVGRIQTPHGALALAARWDGDAALFAIATPQGLACYMVGAGQEPVTASEWSMKGLRGVTSSGRGFIGWSSEGAFLWNPAAGSRDLVLSEGPVAGVSAFGSWISVLTATELVVFSPTGAVAARAGVEGGLALAQTRQLLVVATRDRLRAFDSQRLSRLEPWGWSPKDAVELLPVRGIGASTRVLAVAQGNEAWLLDFTHRGPAVAIQRYRQIPWTARAARAGNLLGRIDPDGHAVTILRRVATAVTREGPGCGCDRSPDKTRVAHA